MHSLGLATEMVLWICMYFYIDENQTSKAVAAPFTDIL